MADFDLIVEIGEVPAQPFREQPADGGLAGAHEADQINAGRAFQFQDHADARL